MITPLDIENKKFSKQMMNGYNVEEVDDFLDDLTVDFNDKFNVLTGETGAGKTLIIGALGIIAGGRFSKDMIRNGEKYSFVESILISTS